MYTRVTKVSDSELTSTEKKHVLRVVNENNEDYFGVWLKVNRKTMMLTDDGCGKFTVEIKRSEYGFRGEYETVSKYQVKLS